MGQRGAGMKGSPRGIAVPGVLWLLMAAGFLLGIAGETAMAADPEISVRVDRNQVAIGESLQMEVEIRGAGGEVDVSEIPHFKVLSRGQSTNVRIVNGEMARSQTHTFALIPEREGRLTIPPLPVRVDGREYPTRPVTIQVTPRTAAPQSADHEVFVRASIRPETLYDGQPGVYTFRFYQSVQVANARYQAPEFQGFTAEEREDRRKFNTRIQGREYHVTEIRYVLIPVGPGERIIEPAVLHCDVLRSGGRRGRFDPFSMFDQSERRVLTTESVSVSVRPLPSYEGSEPFSGLVGRFDLSASVDAAAVRVGDSITHSVTVEGVGNLIDAQAPEISVPEAFKVYADNPGSDIRLGDAGYEGTKVFRNALVPTEPGEFTLPPVRMVYFDSEAGEYRARATDAIRLTVRPGAAAQTAAAPPPAPTPGAALKRQVEFTGRDILPIRDGLEVLEGGGRAVTPAGFLALLGAPALLVLAFGLGRRLIRRESDPVQRMTERSRLALKAARSAKEDAELLAQLHRALTAGILARAGRTGASVTAPEARWMLREVGVPEETGGEAAEVLERIDAARFGGVALTEAERTALPDRTAEILRRLGR